MTKQTKEIDHANKTDKGVDNYILKSQRFPVDHALKLRLVNNFTFQQIADKYGVTRQAVHRKLKRLIKIIGEPDLNRAFAERRVELLTGVERILIQNLVDSDKLKDASLNNVAYAYKEIHNARRLEQGESTENISIHADIRAMKEMETITVPVGGVNLR